MRGRKQHESRRINQAFPFFIKKESPNEGTETIT